MAIALTRVDFRLIHGQVITRWLTQTDSKEIITIDTELSKDVFMQEVFKMAAPAGIKIQILNIDEAVAAQKSGAFDSHKVMLLFKGVEELEKSVNSGLELEEIQIGGLGGGPGRKAVNNAITLDQDDLDALIRISNKGSKVYFQTTPDYPSESLEQIQKKF